MGAGNTVKQVGGAAGGVASMIPGIGTAVGAGISGITSLIGGIMETQEAKKQREQAANERDQANKLKANPLQKEFWAKLRADQMASLSHMPGYNEYIDQLAENSANQARAILESSPNGAATLAAISATLGQQNKATNTLNIQDSAFKVGMEKQVRDDLWSLGEKKDVQRELMEGRRKTMLQQAGALENAATYNKMQGWNQILGGISSTAVSLTKNLGEKEDTTFNKWYDEQKWLKENMGGVGGSGEGGNFYDSNTGWATNTLGGSGGGNFI